MGPVNVIGFKYADKATLGFYRPQYEAEIKKVLAKTLGR